MEFYRTPETIALNAKLEIVRLDDYRFGNGNVSCGVRGWGFFIEGKGFVKFKHHKSCVPYCPCGGKKALQSIIAHGGFVDYDGLEFIKSI